MASAKLDLVRSIYADWEQGNFSSVEWADPEIQLVAADGPAPGNWTGLAEMAAGWRDFLSTWEKYRPVPEEYRELDDERVLVLMFHTGRGRASGLDLEQMRTPGANVFHIHGGKVTRLILYWDRHRVFADLGLEGESEQRG